MTGTRATGALVRVAWQQDWNRSFRFSRAKAGIWLAVFQLGMGALMLWRLGGGALGQGSVAAAMLAMLVQAGVWSFIMAFLGGRQQLFGSRAVTLLHVSPAPSFGPVAAAALGQLPRRAWSMLLWAAGLGLTLPMGERWFAIPLLWVLGVAAGTVAQLGGLLALLAWARLAPRLLGGVWVALLVLQVAGVYYLVYLVARGLPPAALQAAASSLRWWLAGVLGGVMALPGLMAGVMLVAAPGRLGELYREGWLALAEEGDASTRPRCSRWPAAAPGPVGAVLAKEWQVALRNPATYFRLGAVLLLLAGLLPFRDSVADLAMLHHDWIVLGTGVGLVIFAFGEMPAASFSAEGARVGLYSVAGVGARHVLGGKLLAMLPLGAVAALVGWVASVMVGDSFVSQMRAALLCALVVLGAVAVAVSGASFDAAIQEAREEPDLQALAALMEQVPRGFGGNAGVVGALAFAGAAVWAMGGGVGSVWLVVGALVPAMAVASAYVRLRNLLGS